MYAPHNELLLLPRDCFSIARPGSDNIRVWAGVDGGLSQRALRNAAEVSEENGGDCDGHRRDSFIDQPEQRNKSSCDLNHCVKTHPQPESHDIRSRRAYFPPRGYWCQSPAGLRLSLSGLHYEITTRENRV
jgi:hypothetical protein